VLQDASAIVTRVLPDHDAPSVKNDVKSEQHTTDPAISIDAGDSDKNLSVEGVAFALAADCQAAAPSEWEHEASCSDTAVGNFSTGLLVADTEGLSSTCNVSPAAAAVTEDAHPADVCLHVDAVYCADRTVHVDGVSDTVEPASKDEGLDAGVATAVALCDANTVSSHNEAVAASEVEGLDLGTAITACNDADVSKHDNVSSHVEADTASEVAADSFDAEFIPLACSEGSHQTTVNSHV